MLTVRMGSQLSKLRGKKAAKEAKKDAANGTATTTKAKSSEKDTTTMPLHRAAFPPATPGESYIIPQLEGERITIPGSKGVFRILASANQTNSKIAVFTSGAVLSDAPGFHYHNEAHDVFLVTKGMLKLWNGDACRILGPGDFAYVPPVSCEAFSCSQRKGTDCRV